MSLPSRGDGGHRVREEAAAGAVEVLRGRPGALLVYTTLFYLNLL